MKIACAFSPSHERKIACIVTLAMTLAMTSGVIVRSEKSRRITSSVNKSPPIGELKIALMPAAEPQPIRTDM